MNEIHRITCNFCDAVVLIDPMDAGASEIKFCPACSSGDVEVEHVKGAGQFSYEDSEDWDDQDMSSFG